MTERRPVSQAHLAVHVRASETHRADLWRGPFGDRATCGDCAWEAHGEDLASLAGRAATHAPRVKVFSPDGELIADGAREQRAARRRWDRGDSRTVGEAIKERINGQEENVTEENVTQDEDRELDMSEEIRRQARAGSPLSQSLVARLEASAAEDAARKAAEPARRDPGDALRSRVQGKRNAARASLGFEGPSGDRKREEEPGSPSSPTDFIREAVASRRRRNDEAYRERLFGPDTTDAGEAGEEEA